MEDKETPKTLVTPKELLKKKAEAETSSRPLLLEEEEEEEKKKSAELEHEKQKPNSSTFSALPNALTFVQLDCVVQP